MFVQFRKMIKTQFNCNIKSLQSDWGGEFHNVSTFLQHHGIHHRVSCPYPQEQNGAVERRNRIIIEKGLSLLAQSSLPQIFWEHAFKTATYLHNRTITPLLSYQSPYQKLYHKSPDYCFLITFGCLCYPFLRPYNTHKLDFRSLPCVFLGYSVAHKGYLCFHKPTSRIYISRHVVFNEDVFPYSLHAGPTVPTLSTSPQPTTPHILQHAADLLCPPPSPPHSTNQSSSSIPKTSSTTPSYQQPTISSHAKHTHPSTSHFRPADKSTHPMVTRARIDSLKPKTFSISISSTPTIEPHTFKQAIQHPCWQQAMQHTVHATWI